MELIVALVVVLISQGVTLIVANKTLKQQSDEAARNRQTARDSEWKSYLMSLMNRLIEARRDYEQFLCTDKTDQTRHGGIIGMAISVCLAAADNEMKTYVDGDKARGIDGLTPYFVEKGEDGALEKWDSRNRKAMQLAVDRLADMIKTA